MKIWLCLGGAIIFEVIGTSLLKMSDGFTKWHYAAFAMVAYWGSFWLLSVTLTKIPIGVAYAIWSGVGIVLVTLIGWMFFAQLLKPVQLVFISLILVGAIGLNLTTSLESSTAAEKSA